MQKFWVDGGNTDLYHNWIGTVIEGLFWKGGIYNSAALKTFLTNQLKDITINRLLSVGITDVLSGAFTDFTEKNITDPDTLVNVMYASFAYAGFFPPVEAFGSQWFDGSAVWELDIFSAINKCLSVVTDESDIIVDVILTSSANLKEIDASSFKSVSMLFRYLEISSFYNSMDGLLRAKFAFPQINFRYVVSPTQSFPAASHPMVRFIYFNKH
jgi:hypothetical protein